MGDFNQTSAAPFPPPDPAVFQEYGLDVAERAHYAAGDRKLELTALRAKDATGAFAIYHWLRPQDSRAAETAAERAVQAGDATLLQYGNYVLMLRGDKPEEDHLLALLQTLPRFERSPPPPLVKHMPTEARVGNSERYILGPLALNRLAPAVPPSAAGFHLGVEAQVADYHAEGGSLKLALFSYPTPQMARGQFEEFQKIPGLMCKRSGPLIAAVLNPFSRDESERLLARVRYEATITWNQKRNNPSDDVAGYLVSVVMLSAILVGFMLVVGLGLGGVRVLLARWLPGTRFDTTAEPRIIRLNLDGK